MKNQTADHINQTTVSDMISKDTVNKQQSLHWDNVESDVAETPQDVVRILTEMYDAIVADIENESESDDEGGEQ